jgi:lysophospholipase L1-like esterase
VFLVGGSTVECFYVDDEDEIGRVLQRDLQATAPAGTSIRVYNAGLSGTATDDHIAMIAQRIAHLEPDLVVVMCGINDLTRSIYGYDYLHFAPPPVPRKAWYKRLAMHSQIVRRAYFAKQRIAPNPEGLQQQRPLRSNYAALIRLQRSGTESPGHPRLDTASYATNLRTLAGIAGGHGFAMVFVTQQTTWNSAVDPRAKERHWMRYRDGEVYREDRMAAAMDSLNGAMHAVGSRTGVPVYDLASELPASLEYFYDDCHFNLAGAAAAARGLAAFLRANGLSPAAPGGHSADLDE